VTRRDWRMACRGALIAATVIWAWQAGILAPAVMAVLVGLLIGGTWGDPPHGDDDFARRHPARRHRD